MKILLIALLCMSLVLAAPFEDADYLIIVGENAPASDVVTGINFAANIKSQSGAAFTSATEVQVQGSLTADDLARMTYVIIDGDSVQVIRGAKTPESHGSVVQKAFSYFNALGFEVTLRYEERVEPRNIIIHTKREEPIAVTPPEPVVIIEPEPECKGCELDGVCVDAGKILGNQVCMPDGNLMLRKEIGKNCFKDYECASTLCLKGKCALEEIEPAPEVVQEPVVEKESLFTRIINWFKGLFS